MSTSANDPQLLAGEYVLGTLSLSRRHEVDRRIPHDSQLASAVHKWQEQLLPLTTLVEPIAPSPQLWPRIESTLFSAPRQSATSRWSNWWGSLNLWRGLAGSGFAAAAILIAIMLSQQPTVPAPKFMVVLVAPQDKTPGWIVQTSANNQLSLIPLKQTEVPETKSLQFWTKAEGWTGPVSLGLVKPGQTIQIPLDKLPPLQANQLFEITLEPQNGSPIGRPTGPVLFIGRAVKTT